MSPFVLNSRPSRPEPESGLDDLLSNLAASGNLKRRSVRGAAATGGGQAARFALRFGATAILARLIAPEEHGLVAMTAVVTGFARLFQDAGLTTATIQKERITHAQISTLFWINVALGLGLTLLLLAVSPAIAGFYGDQRLVGITCGLSASFTLGGVTVQHQALLRRQMRFRALAVVATASAAVGVAVAVGMALAGLGYWALVGLVVGTALANAIGVWVAMPWVPGPPMRRTGTMPMLKFGGDIMTFNFVNYFAQKADSLLISWYWGAIPLAFYDKAYSLLLLPIGQVNAPLAAVAIPALSRAKANSDQFRRFFLDALRLLATVTVPMVVGIAVFADQVVLAVLGDRWSECANLFRVLAVAALVRAVTNPVGWLLISADQTKRYRQLGFMNSAVIVLSFVAGLRYGAVGVALSYSIAMVLLFVPTWLFALSGSTVSFRDVFVTLLPALASVIPASLVGSSLLTFLDGPQWGVALLAALGGGITYGLTLLVGFRQLPFLLGIVREFKR